MDKAVLAKFAFQIPDVKFSSYAPSSNFYSTSLARSRLLILGIVSDAKYQHAIQFRLRTDWRGPDRDWRCDAANAAKIVRLGIPGATGLGRLLLRGNLGLFFFNNSRWRGDAVLLNFWNDVDQIEHQNDERG